MIFDTLGVTTGLNASSGLGMALLIIGAMFTAAVVVSIVSFYLDEYWEDEEYRNQLRLGSKQRYPKKGQKA